MKKRVKKKQDVGFNEFVGTLEEVKRFAEDLINDYGSDASIDLDWNGGFERYRITYHREETDAEYKRRLVGEEKGRKIKEVKAAKKKAKDLALLAKLKKQYEE